MKNVCYNHNVNAMKKLHSTVSFAKERVALAESGLAKGDVRFALEQCR